MRRFGRADGQREMLLVLPPKRGVQFERDHAAGWGRRQVSKRPGIANSESGHTLETTGRVQSITKQLAVGLRFAQEANVQMRASIYSDDVAAALDLREPLGQIEPGGQLRWNSIFHKLSDFGAGGQADYRRVEIQFSKDGRERGVAFYRRRLALADRKHGAELFESGEGGVSIVVAREENAEVVRRAKGAACSEGGALEFLRSRFPGDRSRLKVAG